MIFTTWYTFLPQSIYFYLGPEPACCISVVVTNKLSEIQHTESIKKHWESLTGLKQAK
jgi:hypothetical protein